MIYDEWVTNKEELKRNLAKLQNCKLSFPTGFAPDSGDPPLPIEYANVIYYHGKVAILKDEAKILETTVPEDLKIPNFYPTGFSATKEGRNLQVIIEELYRTNNEIKWISVDEFLDGYSGLIKESPSGKYTIYREINKEVYSWYNYVTFFLWNGGIIPKGGAVPLEDYDPSIPYELFKQR